MSLVNLETNEFSISLVNVFHVNEETQERTNSENFKEQFDVS